MSEGVSLKEKFAYTGGILGQNMIYNFMAMYIMFFFTDLLGIPPGIATVIIVVASLWDAINDPLMGMIADKTRTRWGKFRPYLIIGPVIVGGPRFYVLLILVWEMQSPLHWLPHFISYGEWHIPSVIFRFGRFHRLFPRMPKRKI